MLGIIEKYRKKKRFNRGLVIVCAIFLTISLGSGVKTALADLDIQN